MTDEPDFIRRWSRRKRAVRQGETPTEERPIDDAKAGPDGETASSAAELGAERDSPESSPEDSPESLDLPDIESLSSKSDFTPFLKKGVPKELRNRAMRKLWRVNPVFGHLDGLNDYDADFTDAATVVKGLKTLYKVGRGFMPERTAETAADAPPDDEPSAIAANDAAEEASDDREEPAPDAAPEFGQKGNKIT